MGYDSTTASITVTGDVESNVIEYQKVETCFTDVKVDNSETVTLETLDFEQMIGKISSMQLCSN